MVQETLRLYPAGWIGSRVSLRDTEFDGRVIPAGRLVLYSPYLTHRDPELWSKPFDFTPERFAGPLPAWGYLPFSAGERTCLGAALATLMLRAAVQAFRRWAESDQGHRAGPPARRCHPDAQRANGAAPAVPRSVPRPPVPSLSGRREDGCSS